MVNNVFKNGKNNAAGNKIEPTKNAISEGKPLVNPPRMEEKKLESIKETLAFSADWGDCCSSVCTEDYYSYECLRDTVMAELPGYHPQDAKKILEAALKSPHYRIQMGAVELIKSAPPEIWTELVECAMRARKQNVRGAAAELIPDMPASAQPVLIGMALESGYEVAYVAIPFIGSQNEPDRTKLFESAKKIIAQQMERSLSEKTEAVIMLGILPEGMREGLLADAEKPMAEALGSIYLCKMAIKAIGSYPDEERKQRFMETARETIDRFFSIKWQTSIDYQEVFKILAVLPKNYWQKHLPHIVEATLRYFKKNGEEDIFDHQLGIKMLKLLPHEAKKLVLPTALACRHETIREAAKEIKKSMYKTGTE